MAPKRTARVAPSNRPPPQNLLLAALPKIDRDRLLALLDVVPLKLKALIHAPGEAIAYVYFPAGGFCSIVTVLEDGSMVEVATIGREGMVGVSAMLNGRPIVSAAMVQGASETCYRMPVAAFRAELEKRGAFYSLIGKYSQALTESIMQSTACNAVHSIEQRLARWLLTAQDRMDGQEFPLTQEFLAMMLGATRPTVTVVAGALQRKGLISYRRGRVTVRNRVKLEAASCECYQTTRRVFRRVIGADGPPPVRRYRPLDFGT